MTGSDHVPLGAGLEVFEQLYASLGLAYGPDDSDDRLEELVSSVNLERLSNYPVELLSDELRLGYAQLFSKGVAVSISATNR